MTRMPPSVANTAAPASASRRGQDNHAATLDDDTLMFFEEGLRAKLPGVEEIVQRAATRKRKTRAAATVAALFLAAGVVWLDPAYQSEQVITGIGERGTWVLSDGSEVTLNTGSTLRVEYHLRSRRLYLPQGEALFKVEHSRWRTFLVYANQTKVRDIGTIFNVRNIDHGARVTVLEGRVEVSTEGDMPISSLLDTGESAEVNGVDLNEDARLDANALAAWKDGKLYFDNTPLAAVVAELQRYRQAPVTLSPALANLRITGQFDIDRIDQLLSLLPTLAPVIVDRERDGSVTIAPRGEARVANAAP